MSDNLRRPIIEVCIDSVAGALAAEAGGADRLELCANLVEGGTTPSTGLIRSVLAATKLPVMVMVRPRGGHFCFDRHEQTTMLSDAKSVLEEPVAGIVIGALLKDGTIDGASCQVLRELDSDRSVTFHRAFDQVADPFAALNQLLELKIDRVLTSGLAPTAEQGLELLAALVNAAGRRISIMPGCGIRAHNVKRIVAATGVEEVHCSASRRDEIQLAHWRTEVPMSAERTTGDLCQRVTDQNEVAAIHTALVDATSAD